MARVNMKRAWPAVVAIGLTVAGIGVAGPGVSNSTAASPLPVVMLTRESIDLAGNASTSGSYSGGCIVELFDVPAGKRLVVEQVAGVSPVTKTTSPVFNQVYLSNGAVVLNTITSQSIGASYFLEWKLVAGPNSDFVTVSQQVRVYVQPTKRLKIVWSTPNYLAGDTCWAYVSGYLEPAP